MELGDCNVGTSSPGVGFVSRDDGMMRRLDMASEQDGLKPRGRKSKSWFLLFDESNTALCVQSSERRQWPWVNMIKLTCTA